jgi:hypothetical protein
MILLVNNSASHQFSAGHCPLSANNCLAAANNNGGGGRPLSPFIAVDTVVRRPPPPPPLPSPTTFIHHCQHQDVNCVPPPPTGCHRCHHRNNNGLLLLLLVWAHGQLSSAPVVAASSVAPAPPFPGGRGPAKVVNRPHHRSQGRATNIFSLGRLLFHIGI